MADDLGWGDVAPNNPDIKYTPNIAALASQGVRYTDYHSAASVCTPSRAGLLTGRLGQRTGVISNFGVYSTGGLPLSEHTMADYLKSVGYKTGIIGKWHLGELPKYQPQNRGFNYFVSYDQDLTPFNPLLNVNGTLKKISGHTSNIFADYAIQFLRKNQNNKFALTVAFREPQVPWHQVPEEDLRAVEHIDPIVPERDGIDQEWLKKITRNNYRRTT